MRKFLFLFLFSIFIISTNGQELPRWITEEEKFFMPAYLDNFNKENLSTPPPFEVRNMAEWEEVEYLVITWATRISILREIVRHGREEAKVLIVCADSTLVKSYLQAGGVSLSNVFFLEDDFNSIWMRDYFGNTAYKNDVDSLVMVDWIYNRPRPDDDKVPHAVGNYLSIPIYETAVNPNRLVNTGGNYMSDGLGKAFSSNLVIDENPSKSKSDIDGIMDDFLGLNTYTNMTNLPYDDIHHIDMHMKLMNENTLLIGEYPSGVADGPTIEANINYVLSNYMASNGEPYEIKRIDMPKPSTSNWPDKGGYYYTYANMVFVNNLVLVPIYNLPEDSAALQYIRELMPGYKVVGIDCSSIISLGGAIHCITHTIGVKNPLLINHFPLATQEDNGLDYSITATANHVSGIKGMNLYWSTDSIATFNMVTMNPTANANEFEAKIPYQIAGSFIYYYIEAEANNNKKQSRPMPAPKGFYNFEVLPFTGIKEEKFIEISRVFPNPTDGITAIELNQEISEEISIKVLDILGREIFNTVQTPFKSAKGKSQVFIDASGFNSGIYFLNVESRTSFTTFSFIVK
jgi:agmatine deiminase